MNYTSDIKTNDAEGVIMKKVKVLVTAVGGPTAIGVMKCLMNQEDIELIGTDMRKESAGNAFCRKIYPVHSCKDPAYKDDILSIVKKESIDAVIPTMQDEISLFHDFDPGAWTALPESDHTECLTDKQKMYELLQNDLPDIIPFYIPFTENDELNTIYADYFLNSKVFCVKATNSHGGLGFAVLSGDEETLIQALENHRTVIPVDLFSKTKSKGRMLAMEYLQGQEYSVDILLNRGEVIACVPRLRSRVSTGIVIEGTVEKNDALIDLASRVAKRLIRSGFINLQFFVNGQTVKLIDLNARFCGSQVHSYGAGVNFPYLLLEQHFYGRVGPVRPKWNTRIIRYWESVFFND